MLQVSLWSECVTERYVARICNRPTPSETSRHFGVPLTSWTSLTSTSCEARAHDACEARGVSSPFSHIETFRIFREIQ